MVPWTIAAAFLCLAAAQPPQGCPSNERSVSCVNLCNDCWSKGACEQPFCEPGCDCMDGHFRDDSGECVPEAWCPSDELCDANEVYSDCAVPCNTCDRRGDCDYICEPGCDCKEGFHRAGPSGECVPRNRCPPPAGVGICPVDEVMVECAKPAWCNTCDLRGRCRLANCSRGCDCPPGHYRDAALKCVPEYKCHALMKCGPDEQHYSCMPDCTQRCRPDGKACAAACRPGCFCRPGLLRHEDGRCVAAQDCVADRHCDRPDEEFFVCKPFCSASCASRGRPCPDLCLPGCFCRKGLMQRDDGACVTPHQCSGEITSPETPSPGVPDFIFGRRRGGDSEEDNRTSSAAPSPSPSALPASNSTMKQGSTMSSNTILPTASTDSSPTVSSPITTKESSPSPSSSPPLPSMDSSLLTTKDSSSVSPKESSPPAPLDSSASTPNASAPSTQKESSSSKPTATNSSTTSSSATSLSELTREAFTVPSMEVSSASPIQNATVSSTPSLSASESTSKATVADSLPSLISSSPSAASNGTGAVSPTASVSPPSGPFLDAGTSATLSTSTVVPTTLSRRPAAEEFTRKPQTKEDSLQTTKASSTE